MRCMVWVYLVCLGPIKRKLGVYEVNRSKGLSQIHVNTYNFIFRITRQLNFKRTLISPITAKLEIPGFSYEAFEHGGIYELIVGYNFHKMAYVLLCMAYFICFPGACLRIRKVRSCLL